MKRYYPVPSQENFTVGGQRHMDGMSLNEELVNVFCGSSIQPGDEEAMENLARYTCPPIFVPNGNGVLVMIDI